MNTYRVAVFLISCTILGCGGGGGGGAETAANGPDTSNDNQPVVVPTTGNNNFTVSGTLSANDALQVDSDVNDPFTAAVGNNTLASAQLIPNPAIIKGFATANPTGIDSDYFSDNPDEFDIFRLSAFASQSVLLEIADFDTNNPATIDLDLGLFDINGNLIVTSVSVANSFESLVIPTDGDYFLAVNAFTGRSNYTLTISTQFATTAFDSQISIPNLRTDQFVMERAPRDVENIDFVANLLPVSKAKSKNEFGHSGITLNLDEGKIQSYSNNQLVKASIAGTAHRKSIVSLQTSRANSQSNKLTPNITSKLSVLDIVKNMNSREGEDVFSPVDYASTMQVLNSDPLPDRLLQWNLNEIGWTDAQNQLQNISFQKRPVIAVIDSGLFLSHPDLEGVIVDQRDFVPQLFDGDGFVADASEDVSANVDPRCHSFHGTHVATTAVAPQNDIGITGVAPAAGLMGIKVGYNASSQLCGRIVGDVANAILYAAGLPNSSGVVPEITADVINLSIGAAKPFPELFDAIQFAVNEGVIVVAAAGNNGAPIRNFPAAYENVIAVAATDILTERAPYSSFYTEVDIAAPGGDSTEDQNGDGFADGVLAGVGALNGTVFSAGWRALNGTSMASPTVAAGIALMKGIEPSLTQNDIEAMLSAGDLTVDIGRPGYDIETGFGLMSLPRMIESAIQFSNDGTSNTDSVTILTSTPTTLDFGAALSEVSLELVQLGNGSIFVDSITGSETLRLSDGTFPVIFTRPDSANGLGVYSFALNRGALEAGAMSGEIMFNLTDGTTHSVPVSYLNQAAEGFADSAAVFFIIERFSSDGAFQPVTEQFVARDGLRGNVPISPRLEGGSYRILYGTDIDNDSFICDEGELCGTLPFNNFGFDSTFILDENISGVTYLLQDIANVALNSLDQEFFPAVSQRAVNKKQLSPKR